MKSKKWIQKAHLKKGALHKQLGFPEGEEIPESTLLIIKHAKVGDKVIIPGTHFKRKGRITVTKLLKRRVQLALNIRK